MFCILKIAVLPLLSNHLIVRPSDIHISSALAKGITEFEAIIVLAKMICRSWRRLINQKSKRLPFTITKYMWYCQPINLTQITGVVVQCSRSTPSPWLIDVNIVTQAYESFDPVDKLLVHSSLLMVCPISTARRNSWTALGFFQQLDHLSRK